MERILIFLLVFCLVFAFPCVSYALELPSDDAYRVSIEYDDKIEYQFRSWSGNVENSGFLSIGQSLSYGGNYTYGLRFYLDFNLNEYLSKYMSLIQNSTNAWFQINLDLDITMTPAGTGTENVFNLYYNENDTSIVMNTGSFDGNHVSGKVIFSPHELINLRNITSADNVSTGLEFFSYTGSPLTKRNCDFIMRSYTLVLYLEGIDGQSYDQFIVITNQLDSVESSINQLKSEVSSKLDSMLTPDSNNQQAVDQMGSQVGSNKQEAEDIKNQIDSLDKPDPDDLIDQIDPDQFINSDDEAVQEMTGILASVTGSKVVKNYLLLLICIGIVSFVVYGKKGG